MPVAEKEQFKALIFYEMGVLFLTSAQTDDSAILTCDITS